MTRNNVTMYSDVTTYSDATMQCVNARALDEQSQIVRKTDLNFRLS